MPARRRQRCARRSEEIGLDRRKMSRSDRPVAEPRDSDRLRRHTGGGVAAAPLRPGPRARRGAGGFHRSVFELVTAPERFSVERRRWRGQWRSFYTVPHGPYYIWGATARILRNAGRPDGGVMTDLGALARKPRRAACLLRCWRPVGSQGALRRRLRAQHVARPPGFGSRPVDRRHHRRR